MKVEIVIWALEATQKAAANVLNSLTHAKGQTVKANQRANDKHTVDSRILSDKTVVKQAKLDKGLNKKIGKIAAKKAAIQTQVEILEGKLS